MQHTKWDGKNPQTSYRNLHKLTLDAQSVYELENPRQLFKDFLSCNKKKQDFYRLFRYDEAA